MKKLIFLFSFVFVVFAANAQNATLIPLAAGDTLVNTGTQTKVIRATGGYSGVAIQVKISKVSGTGGGTVTIKGSLDGTNYETIGSAYTITDVTTQTKTFYISAPLPTYIEVVGAGTGTVSEIMRVYYVFRKYQQ